MEQHSMLNEELLNNVNGGTIEGNPSEYDRPEDVVFLFASMTYVRIAARRMRGTVLEWKAEIDPVTSKYGACYLLRANSGEEKWYFERELTAGTV